MTASDLSNVAEREYAQTLDDKGIPWERPKPKCFRFANHSYTPDFYLPIQNMYVEVIGSRQRWHQLKGKLEEFKQHHPSVVLRVVAGDGTPIPRHKTSTKAVRTYVRKRSVSTHVEGEPWDTRDAGRLGGIIRAAKMTTEERREFGRKMARARWGNASELTRIAAASRKANR